MLPDFSPHADTLRARGITSSPELCELLLEETGVAWLPGCDFGWPAHESTARMAYVNFDGRPALEAVGALPLHDALNGDFLRSYCGDALTAVERVSGWVSQGRECLSQTLHALQQFGMVMRADVR